MMNTPPQLGIGNAMLVAMGKTKFGVFYGDNTGYAQACRELAMMFNQAGEKAAAEKYVQRADDMQQRLDALSWNGKILYALYLKKTAAFTAPWA